MADIFAYSYITKINIANYFLGILKSCKALVFQTEFRIHNIFKMENDLQAIKDTRRGVRSNFTRLANKIKRDVTYEEDINVLEELDHEIFGYIDNLEKIERQHKSLDSGYDLDDAHKHKSYVDTYETASVLIQRRIIELKNVSKSPSSNNASSTVLSNENIKLLLETVQKSIAAPQTPKVSLPVFDSEKEGNNFVAFILEMEDFFKNNNTDESQKYGYLRGQLKGRALNMLEGLPFDQRNYAFAKKLLTAAFADDCKQKQNTLKSLMDLQYKDSLSFYSQLNSIYSNFQFSKITVEDIIQFHAWRCLPAGVRNNLLTIVGKAQPSLSDILDNVFSAQQRVDEYLELKGGNKRPQAAKNQKFNQHKKKDEKGMTTLATNVQKKSNEQTENKSGSFKSKKAKRKKNKDPFCSLCNKDGTDFNHSLASCEVYKDAFSKLKRLKELSGCNQCGFASHDSSKCKMNKLKCSKCEGRHIVTLCTSNGVATTTAGVAVLNATEEKNSINSSVLPTLQVSIKNKNYRSLLDSGCQANFLREDLVKELQLPILEERVALSINGINNRRNYVIKQVEALIKVGATEFKAKFYTLPSIDISVNVNGLHDLIDDFSKLGIKLADPALMNSGPDVLDNFDLIIGISDFKNLNITNVFIGNACLWETNDHVIIFGDIDDLDREINSVLATVSSSLE